MSGTRPAFDMPVLWQVVAGATPERAVRVGDAALLQPFIEAGMSLVAKGARALTTSCGFLVRYQRDGPRAC